MTPAPAPAIPAAPTELAVRTAWTLARLGEAVNAARRAGWLAGDALGELGDPDQLLAGIDEPDAPMRCLASRLGLTATELDVLWLLACIELDPGLARAAQLLVAPGMHELDAQLVERLATRGACQVDAPVLERLARYGLIETTFDPRVPRYRRPVRVNDQVVELARGRLALDRELAELAELVTALDSRRGTTGLELEVPAALRHAAATSADVLVVATGVEGSGREALLRHAISSTGHAVLVVRGAGLAIDPAQLARQLRAIARECRLHDAWPLLLEIDELTERVALIERELLRAHVGPVLATAREACTWPIARPVLAIPLGLPTEAQRARLWERALPGAADEVTQACARRYAIAPGLLTRTATAATAIAQRSAAVTVDQVQLAMRSQLERRLLGLAHRIDTRQTWEDLVLPVDQVDLLIELVARVRHRHQVLDTWGFADKVGKGLGLSALLSGPPGTGKTMIAGLVARELGLDLYQVDLSRVVSKYIGETEKQLAALFEAAEAGHAVLLFDEADSLFGKRTEVKSSNDRYANLEVNYLLQRMEAFTGISLLTTNHETAIDPAFQRRLAFHVRVPMPDEAQRALLWRTMLPERAARAADLDVTPLACAFVMSGGYIKNAVVRAAFLAADARQAISNTHLWRAARAEYEAMGKVAFEAHSASRSESAPV